jgi:hypothetical protein
MAQVKTEIRQLGAQDFAEPRAGWRVDVAAGGAHDQERLLREVTE